MAKRPPLTAVPTPAANDEAPATGADRMSALPKPEQATAPAAPAADAGKDWNREARAALSQMTGGLSPQVYGVAWADWWLNLAVSPAKQAALWQQATQMTIDTLGFAQRAVAGASPTEGVAQPDKRYADPAWSQFPYNVFARMHQNAAQLARNATHEVPGMDPYNREIVDFNARLALDATSPSNYLPTNPLLVAQTTEEQGQNLVRGFQHMIDDLQRTTKGLPAAGTEAFEVGKHVAVTPGKVVYRNALIELIQYSPTTPDVHKAPVLIVPAWIMKYYILDLSPKNSMVRWLVEQGHTVFCVSWKNPDAGDRDRGMDDYLRLGLYGALDAVEAIVPGTPIQGVGYCIGGTLLSIGAAALAQKGDKRLGSVTLLAAQTDFSEPGELSLFINPSQLAMLDAQMYKKGVLDSSQMGGAFALLRPQDLILQPAVNTFLKGKRDAMVDLMAWNADGTRMPWRMHSEYLHRLYLHNELASNRFPVEGTVVTLSDIQIPMFVVGTETDHVAPWKSVYKLDTLTRSPSFTFLLTSGGHNAGIVSGPVHPKRHHRIRERKQGEQHLTPDQWMKGTEKQPGSWWPTWAAWLADHGGGKVAPPSLGAPGFKPLEDAPGTYVRQR
jgi:polyhydroxyalkanoate synthase subunit PhaC